VTGAFDAAFVEGTLIEFAAVVRADVLDRIEGAVDVAKQDGFARDLDAASRAGRDVGNAGDGFGRKGHRGAFARRPPFTAPRGTLRAPGKSRAMNADSLRALQAPLKDRYRAEPAAALVTLHAEGRLDDPQGVSCSVETGRALVTAGLHPATGGDGMLACSGDMLLQALVACAGVTLRAVATATGIPVTAGTVRAEGELDFRGTLGIDKAAPVGFKTIRLVFDLESEANDEQLATLRKLTERYCVVYQTLAAGVAPETEFRTRVAG